MAERSWPTVEPKTRRFLEEASAAGGKPIYKLAPEDARRVLVDLQTSGGAPRQPAEVEERQIPGPQGDVPLYIYRPQGRREELPVVMYFHGGGWVLGERRTHDRLVREIANAADAAVVFVEFTHAPEARYPVQIEEAFAATRWIAQNGGSLGLDTSRMAVMGDSVGGNMATVVAMMCKQRGGPQLGCQVLLYPVTDANFDTGSYRQFAEGYFLEREGMKWFWGHYLPDEQRRTEPYASPLRASTEELQGLPPALVMVAENDVLRDEGEAYARKLAEAGVVVEAVRVLGTIHDFAMLNPLMSTPAARLAVRLACDNLSQIFLSQEVARRRQAERGEALRH